jgi:hypothetical protein
MSDAAAWKFSWLTLRSLLWHRSTSTGKIVLHPKVIIPLVTVAVGAPAAMAALGATALATVTAVGVVATIPTMVAGLRMSDWSKSKDRAIYTNPSETIVLVVKRNSVLGRLFNRPPAWKPDLHIKADGVSPEEAAAFRQDITARVLQVADDLGLPLKITARDSRLAAAYRTDLEAAQDLLGIPAAERREFIITGKAWPRGEHCVASPVPKRTEGDSPAPNAGHASGTQGRQPAGTPSGGEYAAVLHTKSPVRLPGPGSGPENPFGS